MVSQHFYIRTDASSIIGSGHFVRCLNLAKSLIKKGASVTFLSRSLGSDLIRQLVDADCQIIDLCSNDNFPEQHANDYTTWLGATEEDDISQCLNFIGDEENKCIIIDHYGVNEEWICKAKNTFNKLIVLDDLAERKLDVDIVVNQNLGWKNIDYKNLVGQETRLLLGPQYAILSENYAAVRQKLVRHFTNDGPLHVLVSLGAADVDNISSKIALVLKEIQSKVDLMATIIVGSMNPNLENLKQICQSSDGKIKILQGKNNLADVYVNHDIAIGAVGGSAWERCCLGLPTILVPIAENQKPAAKKLHLEGAGILLDCLGEEFEDELFKALEKMCYPDIRHAISKKAMQISDGRGSNRVANAMMFDQ